MSTHKPRNSASWTSSPGRIAFVTLGIVGLLGSTAYWYGVQSALTSNQIMVVVYTGLMVFAPPMLLTFSIPTTIAGDFLRRQSLRTYGYWVIAAATVFLLWYAYRLQLDWWSLQPVVKNSGFVLPQVIVGIIGFIICPALAWVPATSGYLVDQMHQAYLVKRYELQTQADLALLRNESVYAQSLAAQGLSQLTADERAYLVGHMAKLVKNIDTTLAETVKSVKTVSSVEIPFNSLTDNKKVQASLEQAKAAIEPQAPSRGALSAPQSGEPTARDAARSAVPRKIGS